MIEFTTLEFIGVFMVIFGFGWFMGGLFRWVEKDWEKDMENEVG